MKEHKGDCDKDHEGSHAAIHLQLEHPQEWKQDSEAGVSTWRHFKIKTLSSHRTAFRRQLHEAVSISREPGTVLNNLDEYSRCLIPTLEVKRGRHEASGAKKSREL